jgi:hypothetical protein
VLCIRGGRGAVGRKSDSNAAQVVRILAHMGFDPVGVPLHELGDTPWRVGVLLAVGDVQRRVHDQPEIEVRPGNQE